MDRDLLIDDDGRSLCGLCGRCQINVDNHTPNHRVSAIMRGGRGVECVLRGDIEPAEAAPLGARPAEERAPHMVVDLTDQDRLNPRPFGKFGPFDTKADAVDFIATTMNPRSFMALPSGQCR